MNDLSQKEIHYRLLKLLAERMGIRVGIVNYCIREPVRKA
jgi:hypothetical protein